MLNPAKKSSVFKVPNIRWALFYLTITFIQIKKTQIIYYTPFQSINSIRNTNIESSKI